MRNELIHYKSQLFLLLTIFTFLAGFVLVSLAQTTELSSVQKSIVNWTSWIALYFIAQFGVAIFIGKMIRSQNLPN